MYFYASSPLKLRINRGIYWFLESVCRRRRVRSQRVYILICLYEKVEPSRSSHIRQIYYTSLCPSDCSCGRLSLRLLIHLSRFDLLLCPIAYPVCPLFLWLLVHLSVHLSVPTSVWSSVNLPVSVRSSIYPFVCVSLWQSLARSLVCPSVWVFAPYAFYSAFHPSLCLSIYPSVLPSVYTGVRFFFPCLRISLWCLFIVSLVVRSFNCVFVDQSIRLFFVWHLSVVPSVRVNSKISHVWHAYSFLKKTKFISKSINSFECRPSLWLRSVAPNTWLNATKCN